MANIAASYLIGSGRAVEDYRGRLWIEGYLVENVHGRTSLLDALGAGGLPLYGQPLDGYTDMFVVAREPRPFTKDSRTDVVVEITYGPPNIGDLAITTVVEFHGTTREVTRHVDRFGVPIRVDYTEGVNHTVMPHQIGEVRYRKAEGVLTADFQVNDDPSDLESYLNTYNGSPWRGGAAYTWLCIDVSIAKIFYRSGWRVRMAFYYDPETHIPTAFYKKALGGEIPNDIQAVSLNVDSGNGWTNVDAYPTSNFNSIPMPTTY